MALKQDHLGFSWIIYLSSGGAKDYILYRSFKKAQQTEIQSWYYDSLEWDF